MSKDDNDLVPSPQNDDDIEEHDHETEDSGNEPSLTTELRQVLDQLPEDAQQKIRSHFLFDSRLIAQWAVANPQRL